MKKFFIILVIFLLVGCGMQHTGSVATKSTNGKVTLVTVTFVSDNIMLRSRKDVENMIRQLETMQNALKTALDQMEE